MPETLMNHRFQAFYKIQVICVNFDIIRSLGHESLEITHIYLDKVFAKENHAIHSWKPELFGEYI